MALSKYLVRMLPDLKHGAICGNKIWISYSIFKLVCRCALFFFWAVCILTIPKTQESHSYNPENFVNIIISLQCDGYNRQIEGLCTDSEWLYHFQEFARRPWCPKKLPVRASAEQAVKVPSNQWQPLQGSGDSAKRDDNSVSSILPFYHRFYLILPDFPHTESAPAPRQHSVHLSTDAQTRRQQ